MLNYQTIIKNVPPKQNLVFGFQFSNPANTFVLYKEHMYSLFLLLYYHGEPKHKQAILNQLKQFKEICQIQIKKQNLLIQTRTKQKKDQQMINMIQFVEQQFQKNSISSQFHTISDREKIRRTFKGIFQLHERLTVKTQMNIVDFAYLAAGLIGAKVNVKDYFDFQLIQFIEEEFEAIGLDVFIQISKQNQSYRYIKQKMNPKITKKDDDDGMFDGGLMFQPIKMKRAQSFEEQIPENYQQKLKKQEEQQYQQQEVYESVVAQDMPAQSTYKKDSYWDQNKVQSIEESKKIEKKANINTQEIKKSIKKSENNDQLKKSRKPVEASLGQQKKQDENEQQIKFVESECENDELQKKENAVSQTLTKKISDRSIQKIQKSMNASLGQISVIDFLKGMSLSTLEKMPKQFYEEVTKKMETKYNVGMLDEMMHQMAKQSQRRQKQVSKQQSINILKHLIFSGKQEKQKIKNEEKEQKESIRQAFVSFIETNDKKEEQKQNLNKKQQTAKQKPQKKQGKIVENKGLKTQNINRIKTNTGTEQIRNARQNRMVVPRYPISHASSRENRKSINYKQDFEKIIERISERKERRLSNSPLRDDYGSSLRQSIYSHKIKQSSDYIQGLISDSNRYYQRIKLMTPITKKDLVSKNSEYVGFSDTNKRFKYHYPI